MVPTPVSEELSESMSWSQRACDKSWWKMNWDWNICKEVLSGWSGWLRAWETSADLRDLSFIILLNEGCAVL